MSINICSSTSTTDLYQRQIVYSDSFTQTMTYDHDDDDDDDYANYEESHLEHSSIIIHKNIIQKSDQTTLCRTNRYSVGCLTKPASLIEN